MDLQEEIHALGRKSKNFGDKLLTEEATKNTLVMPFIKMLGYDPFDPTEVVPEYSTAIGDYKDSRVDYAIMQNGSAIIIIECKAYGSDLDAKKSNQLMHYFHGSEAKVAILTDGNRYLFYSDLEEPNKMDSKPYMEVVLENFDSALLSEVKKLTKGNFNIEDAMLSASVMKYTREFKRVMSEQLANPNEDFLAFFLKQCYDGRITSSVKEKFQPILKDALNLFIRDRINERLQSAIEQNKSDDSNNATNNQQDADEQATQVEIDTSDEIVTTDEEKEAFFIVKSLLHSVMDSEKIIFRDYKGFSNICYESPRQIIVRLYFNNKPLKIALIHTSEDDVKRKEQEIFQIDKVSDIYKYSDKILEKGKTFTVAAQAVE